MLPLFARGAHRADRLRAAGGDRGPRRARRLVRVPYPVTLVLGGAVIGFLPGVPEVELDPDLVLLIFLPPLLYGAAFFTSVRDLRRNARPIALLSIALVLVTMGAVAVVAHEVIGLDWAGPSCSARSCRPRTPWRPPRSCAAIGAPRRLIAIVEGENLTNDWTALVLYRVRRGRGGQRLVLARRRRSRSSCSAAWAAWPSAWPPAGHPRGAPPDRRPAHRDHDLDPVAATRPTCRPRSSGSPA